MVFTFASSSMVGARSSLPLGGDGGKRREAEFQRLGVGIVE